MFDPAGELFDPRAEARRYERQRNLVFDHLKDCSGLLFLLDPSMPQQHLANSWNASVGTLRAYARVNNLNSLVQGNKVIPRTAVLLTKADRLPFLRRHRTRKAERWLEHEGGLRELVGDIRRSCREVEFYFCSAVGWKEGCENCRTYVVPYELTPGALAVEGARERRDLIPDPPVSAEGDLGSPVQQRGTSLPLFRDPLQIADAHTYSAPPGQPAAGVLVAPGRQPPSRAAGNFINPWNVVEPLLWAAGVGPS